MSNADDSHFESYRQQTRIKHAILEGYLKPFFDITKSFWNRLLYIDGFAGRGYYVDENGQRSPGSPLRALSLFGSKADFASRVQSIFVEQSDSYFGELQQCVSSFAPANALEYTPITWNLPFAKAIPKVFAEFSNPNGELPATFLFVDPCGVEGFPIDGLSRILSKRGCEGFVFFNYEGVNRVVGNAEVVGGSPTLTQLLGDHDAVRALLARTSAAQSSEEREEVIVAEYSRVLRQRSGAQFILPFRVESEGREATSHYFLHVTKNETGFRIMKEVMWKAGKGEGNSEGQFQLLQVSQESDGLFLRPDLQAQSDSVLRDLATGPSPVRRYYKEWVHRPNDLFTESSYRRCLLRLETEKKIRVLKPDGKTPYPAELRRPHKGAPSLSETLWVCLRV